MGRITTAICALTMALSFGLGGCNDVETKGVSYPTEGCSWNNYYFTFDRVMINY